MALARDEAERLRHDCVGTQHLLLGLLCQAESDDETRAMLDKVVRVGDLREFLARTLPRGRAMRASGSLPYTSRSKRALEYAMGEARALRQNDVGPEHLLIGVLRGRGIAAEALEACGATLSGARVELFGDVARVVDLRDRPRRGSRGMAKKLSVLLRGERSGKGRARGDTEPVWFLEVDPKSETPIYEQIIAGIEEAVATGRLEAGERLPPVRQLAEELAVAPGTVARAYSELEKRGVLETDGARGTHVASRPKEVQAGAAEHSSTLEGLLRPVAVAAYHLGASADQLRAALDRAMVGIY